MSGPILPLPPVRYAPPVIPPENVQLESRVEVSSPTKESTLKTWWEELPILDVAQCSQGNSQISLGEEVDTSSCAATAGRATRRGWDYGSLFIRSRLPNLFFLGAILLLGMGGVLVVSSLMGHPIPGFEFIVKYAPVSFVIGLKMLQQGIHLIYTGVRYSLVPNRTRKEAHETYSGHYIFSKLLNLTPEEKQESLREIRRLNWRIYNTARLHYKLKEGQLFGKKIEDLPSGRAECYQFKQEIQQLLSVDHLPPEFTELPRLTNEGGIEQPPPGCLSRLKTKCDTKLRQWIMNRLPALGAANMVLGQVMLFSAIVGLVFMCAPSLIPGGLAVIAHDPVISIAFTLFLIGAWINSTTTGKEMISFNRREKKRETQEEDLQLIDHLLEREMALEFKNWMESYVDQLAVAEFRKEELKEGIRKCYEVLETNFNKIITEEDLKMRIEHAETRWREGDKKPSGLYEVFYTIGEKITPYLRTPSILLGLLLLAFGLFCLTATLGHQVPAPFSSLLVNMPLSVVSACGLIFSGIHAIQTGAIQSDEEKKNVWKEDRLEYRKLFLAILQRGTLRDEIKAQLEQYLAIRPTLAPPKEEGVARGEMATIGNTAHLPTGEEYERRALVRRRFRQNFTEVSSVSCFSKISKGWYSFWRKTLKASSIPDFALAGFLLFCGAAGLGMGIAGSFPIPFLAADPSASAFFWSTAIFGAIGGFSSGYDALTHKNAKAADKKRRDDLEIAFENYLRVYKNNLEMIEMPPSVDPDEEEKRLSMNHRGEDDSDSSTE